MIDETLFTNIEIQGKYFSLIYWFWYVTSLWCYLQAGLT